MDLPELNYKGIQYEDVVLVTSLTGGVLTVAQHDRDRGDAENNYAEAIPSRPLTLHGIARQTRHGNQTTVEITNTHAKASQITELLTKVSAFLKRAVEADPQRCVSSFFEGEGPWKHWPVRRCYRVTAVLRINDLK